MVKIENHCTKKIILGESIIFQIAFLGTPALRPNFKSWIPNFLSDFTLPFMFKGYTLAEFQGWLSFMLYVSRPTGRYWAVARRYFQVSCFPLQFYESNEQQEFDFKLRGMLFLGPVRSPGEHSQDILTGPKKYITLRFKAKLSIVLCSSAPQNCLTISLLTIFCEIFKDSVVETYHYMRPKNRHRVILNALVTKSLTFIFLGAHFLTAHFLSVQHPHPPFPHLTATLHHLTTFTPDSFTILI